MERDSFIFYRSFWDAIKVQSREIQTEVLQAIVEYALEGKLPQDAGPITLSMFALMRPVIDRNNIRFANGKKGGRPPRRPSAAPKKSPVSPPPMPGPAAPEAPVPASSAPQDPAPIARLSGPVRGLQPEKAAWASFEEEISWLRTQHQWAESFRRTFSLSEEALTKALDAFLLHCQTERDPADLHRDPSDLRRHISSWMRLAKPTNTTPNENPTAKTPQRKPRNRKATLPSDWTPDDFSSEI